jgi:hypothetical protein
MLCLSIYHKETKNNNKYSSLFELLGVNGNSLGIFYCEIKYIISLSESSSEMKKERIRNNVNNSGSEVVTREVLT